MWFMGSWWSTVLACACILVLAGIAWYKMREVERLRAEKDAPTLYEALRKDRDRP